MVRRNSRRTHSRNEDAEEEQTHSTDDVIASLASGGDVLDKPKTKIDNLRAQIENAKLESANWRLAEQAVEARRPALGLAALFVVVAARAVVTKEVNAAATMCACEAFRNEVLDMQGDWRRSRIRWSMPANSAGRSTTSSMTSVGSSIRRGAIVRRRSRSETRSTSCAPTRRQR